MSIETYKVLNSRIPQQGRNLTSAEANALRDAGVSCSRLWWVLPASGTDYTGHLYYYNTSRVLTSAGVTVNLKEGK